MAQPAHRTGFWQSLRELPGRTPLRVKLITVMLVLVGLALMVISVAGITILKRDLLSTPDRLLNARIPDATSVVYSYVNGASSGSYPGIAVDWVTGEQVHQVVLPTNEPARQSFGAGGGVQGPPVYLPGPRVPTSSAWLAAHYGQFTTLPSVSGGLRWRVVLYPASLTNSASGRTTVGTIVLATDVTSAYTTIGQLVSVDWIVSGLLLVLLAVVGVAVIRASLRPLTDIEKTAGAIAAGDLSRRVPERDPRTEVGRLGRSLNAMLSQIETAFQARSQSEAAARRSEEKMRQFVADASHELRTPLTAIRGFAEYYRQRGGIAAAPEPQPERTALASSTAQAGSTAQDATTAQAGTAASDQAGPPASVTAAGAGEHAAATAADGTGPDLAGRPAPARKGGNGTGQLASTDLDRIMRRVEQESSRMGVLVEDMLLLARLDQQRPLEQRPVDLLTLAADAVHDARVVAPGRSINLTVGSGAALLVIGDEVRLRQVIGNLMSNALSHTPDGTPIDVLIRSGSLDEAPAGLVGDAQRPAAEPGQAVTRPAAVLEVADHGPGLSSDQAERIFERFYRADQARTSGGTGLGLAIVAALVSAHGGATWVRSQPGNGATFCIALPLSPEAAQSAGEDYDAADEGNGDAEDGAGIIADGRVA